MLRFSVRLLNASVSNWQISWERIAHIRFWWLIASMRGLTRVEFERW